MRRFYPHQTIDLTANPEWKHYTGETLADFFMELSFATLKSIEPIGIAYYAGQLAKIQFTEDQKQALYTAFREDDPRVEQFSALMRQASDWAWEKAYTPTQLDLSQSLKKALNELPSEYADWFSGRPKLWEVYKAYEYKEQWKFISDIVQSSESRGSPIAHITQKDGHYERYLVYNPGASPLVVRMQMQPITYEPEGILDWFPPMATWNTQLMKELRGLLDELRDILVNLLFQHLKIRMESIDYSNRMSFSIQFMDMIRSKTPEVKAAAKEIKAFVAGSPALGANPFMNPRGRRLEKDFREMKALAESSPIMQFEAKGDPPEIYKIFFSGLGLTSKGPLDRHEVHIQLGAEYPRTMPLVRWVTPILHPNISGSTPCFGNFLMNPQVRLIDLVEVIWDMTRLATYNAHQNDQWARLRKQYDFPMDPRTIRGQLPQTPDQGGDVDLIIMGEY